MKKRCPVISMDVDVTNLDTSILDIIVLISLDRGSYICLSNVHMCMEAFDSSSFSAVVNQADIVIPDGKPLSVAQKLSGHQSAVQCADRIL